MLRNRDMRWFALGAALLTLVFVPLALIVHPLWGAIGMALIWALGVLCLLVTHREIRLATEAVERVARGEQIEAILLTREGDLSALVARLSLLAERLVRHAQRHDQDRQAMKRFVEDVSHQLKTPLAALRLTLEARHLKQDDPALDQALSHIDRMTFLIGSLLKLARLEAGTIEMRRRDARLSDTLRIAIESLRPFIEAKNQTVELLGDMELRARHDPEFLGEALQNLIKNACEHSPAAGCVQAVVEPCEDGARVRVRDFGPGIDERQLLKLFDRFQPSDKPGGAGIGLALAKLIVDAHQGDLSARNLDEGGAEFVIRLWT